MTRISINLINKKLLESQKRAEKARELKKLLEKMKLKNILEEMEKTKNIHKKRVVSCRFCGGPTSIKGGTVVFGPGPGYGGILACDLCGRVQ
jgi:hypothetical protein